MSILFHWANNHIYDYGYDAFVDTLALLDENGIRHVGGGMDSEQAEKVEYYEINGIKTDLWQLRGQRRI